MVAKITGLNRTAVERDCPRCGKHISIIVYKDDYRKYKNGEGLIQNIFPYLDANQRESIKTGYCGKCYDEICKEEEE